MTEIARLIASLEKVQKNRTEWQELATEFQELTRIWEARAEAAEARVKKLEEALKETRKYLGKTHREAKHEYRTEGGTVYAVRSGMAEAIMGDVDKILASVALSSEAKP